MIILYLVAHAPKFPTDSKNNFFEVAAMQSKELGSFIKSAPKIHFFDSKSQRLENKPTIAVTMEKNPAVLMGNFDSEPNSMGK